MLITKVRRKKEKIAQEIVMYVRRKIKTFNYVSILFIQKNEYDYHNVF